jgi:hypothetical protein
MKQSNGPPTLQDASASEAIPFSGQGFDWSQKSRGGFFRLSHFNSIPISAVSVVS